MTDRKHAGTDIERVTAELAEGNAILTQMAQMFDELGGRSDAPASGGHVPGRRRAQQSQRG